ncbi:MAG: hypothetical protein JO036_18870 [Candidatus Eremiobacteraeota bacterium]|nr:hypothetical protein [Candidatus Eremiobacteraeota bacterium]
MSVLYPTINCLEFVAYSGTRIVLSYYYVTGQPSVAAYQGMVKAGIKSVLCVRLPGETVESPPYPPPPPFSPADAARERDDLAKLGISFTNIPIERSMDQTDFNKAATAAAAAFDKNTRTGPTMVHCSTGDRASSVFAALLIGYGTPNAEAADYAKNALLLANGTIIDRVLGYRPTAALTAQLQETAAGAAPSLR